MDRTTDIRAIVYGDVMSRTIGAIPADMNDKMEFFFNIPAMASVRRLVRFAAASTIADRVSELTGSPSEAIGDGL